MNIYCARCSNSFAVKETDIKINNSREGMFLTCNCPVCNNTSLIDENTNDVVVQLAVLKGTNYSAYTLIKQVQAIEKQQIELMTAILNLQKKKDIFTKGINNSCKCDMSHLWHEDMKYIVDAASCVQERNRRSDRHIKRKHL